MFWDRISPYTKEGGENTRALQAPSMEAGSITIACKIRSHRMSTHKFICGIDQDATLCRAPFVNIQYHIANKTKSRNIVMVLALKQYQGKQVQNYPAAYADL